MVVPGWLARWDRMAQEKRKPDPDEARVNQRRRGKPIQFKVPQFRDDTPEEVRAKREAMKKAISI